MTNEAYLVSLNKRVAELERILRNSDQERLAHEFALLTERTKEYNNHIKQFVTKICVVTELSYYLKINHVSPERYSQTMQNLIHALDNAPKKLWDRSKNLHQWSAYFEYDYDSDYTRVEPTNQNFTVYTD